MKLVQKSIAMDESYPLAHTQLGWLYIVLAKKYEKGIAECERALALDPNGSNAHIWMSITLRFAGRHEEALRFAEQALRLDPRPPSYYLRELGQAYFHNGRYDEAISALEKALNLTPKDSLTRIFLTAMYSHAGREGEAQTEAAELLRLRPDFCLGPGPVRYKNPEDNEVITNALRKAGLPDCPPPRSSK
jgi:tetratricopeptide (TPR) repeat protein